jgi:hypothetical protein
MENQSRPKRKSRLRYLEPGSSAKIPRQTLEVSCNHSVTCRAIEV